MSNEPAPKKKSPLIKIIIILLIIGIIIGLQFTPAKNILSFESLKQLPHTLTKRELNLEIVPAFQYSSVNIPEKLSIAIYETTILQHIQSNTDLVTLNEVYKSSGDFVKLRMFVSKEKKNNAAGVLNSIKFRNDLLTGYQTFLTNLYIADGEKLQLVTTMPIDSIEVADIPLPELVEQSIFEKYIKSKLHKKKNSNLISSLNSLYRLNINTGLYELTANIEPSPETVKRELLKYKFFDFHQRNALDFANYNYLKKFESFKNRFYLLFVLAFILIYILVVAMQLPGASFLTLGGGFLFGPLIGTVYVNIGASLGAIAAFFVARYLIGKTLQAKFSRQLAKFNREMDKNSALYLLTMRLIPAFPFWLINLLAGLTKIKARTFIWTTSVGIIPGSLVYAFAGSQLNRIKSPGDIMSPQVLLAFGILIIFSIIPIVIKKLFMKKKSPVNM